MTLAIIILIALAVSLAASLWAIGTAISRVIETSRREEG